jgi:hypothetical protein
MREQQKRGKTTGGECVFSFEKTFVKTTGKKRFLCVFSLEKTYVNKNDFCTFFRLKKRLSELRGLDSKQSENENYNFEG